ncbi:MAG TPA: XrtA/PEP-CTERM system histidine kinase PrsK [Acidobacteriota bacterium]|nr:XrtA/PEP-CTERM system histidine kinase PrsK [Acidobacteriota bacterium]
MNESVYSLAPVLSFAAALFTFLVAFLVTVKDHRSAASRSLIVCLCLLALVQFSRGMSFLTDSFEELYFWEKAATVFMAFQPGAFLFFSLVFGRSEYRKYLAQWKYVLAAVFALPVVILALFRHYFYQQAQVLDYLGQPALILGQAGKIFYAVFIIAAVLVLANLEYSLRAATGRIRWQIKFIILGMGGICAVWIYIGSQALIYLAVDTSISVIHAAALLIANVFFLWGLMRSQFLNVDVYLSRTTIQYSLTYILASVYLILLGVFAYIARALNQHWALPVTSLVVLFALIGLAMLLLSDRLNERIKRFVTRHFKRPLHDYRKAWMELTEKTNSLVDVRNLCAVVSRIISQTFGILSVNVWLLDETGKHLDLTGSTVFTPAQSLELERSGPVVSGLMEAMNGDATAYDLNGRIIPWAEEIMRAKPEFFKEFKMRYIQPLTTGGRMVGIITLNEDRVGLAPLSYEDKDLLHAYAAHLAARVLQLRLSEALRQAQEIEAFQNVSAFFVHDLKNLASRLSLTMQNLPVYFDNPAFRDDALKLIGESLGKIDDLCERLSSVKQKIELKPVKEDLNELLTSLLDDFERGMAIQVDRKFSPLPPVFLDREQMQKVVTNLIMNAREAVGDNGKIRVETSVIDRHLVMAVEDNGPGMPREYIQRSLFRPFKSTKKRGMGIGLFHSKMIVEAHGGKIEVESVPGKGTTFRVLLPIDL